MYDTPVRHDELSITRTSLRSRVLISANNQRNNREKLVKNNLISHKDKKISGSTLGNEIDEPKASWVFTEMKDEECSSVIFNECSLMEIEERQAEMTLPVEDTSLYRTNDVSMKEESFVEKQIHSTPRAVKCPAKAVSSTPDQELNNSRLARHASTQTTFTLNARNLEELNDDLKSYCVSESPNNEMDYLSSSSQKLDFKTDSKTTSPIRNNCCISHETPVHKPLAVRKLSLRSKTMICSAMEKAKNKPILARYKSVEEKRLFSNTFSILPHPKTPPTCTGGKVIHNPFETDLPERLGKTLFSPDVFDNVLSPSEDSEYIRWTIEDISSINPVPIEEDFTLPSDDEDPERESQVQQEIDRYFSETHIVLSPYDAPESSQLNQIKEVSFHVRAAASTPQKHNKNTVLELQNANTQTVLTLPEFLPDRLEESLRTYFQFYDLDELNVSNLRRKLFFHAEDEPPSPVRFTSPGPEQSPLSFIKNKRHFTPLGRQQDLSSPEVSPVVPASANLKPKNDSTTTCKKTLHLYFPGDRICAKEVTDNKFVGPVVNSTVIMDSNSQDTLPSSQDTIPSSQDTIPSSQDTLPSSQDTIPSSQDTIPSSQDTLPSSQDTGYHTEKSWQQSPHKLVYYPSSAMASTPTRPVQ